MKFIDHNSPEKAIINDTFKSLPYMDMWISSIVEGYIYEKVDKINEKGCRIEKYTERYGKKEGEYKEFINNLGKEQLILQCYYKDGDKEGELKWWHPNGQLGSQEYYKEGKREGELKWWCYTGQLVIQEYYKDGKREGEYKWWFEEGKLIEHKIYKDGEIVQDFLSLRTLN